MPITRIELARKWSRAEKDRLLAIVHRAMMDSLKIPERDRQIRIFECEEGDFAYPPECSNNYVLIEISMFSGRSMAAKRKLYKNIVDGLEELGVARHDVLIVLHDVPRENWGIRGGVPASEVDLGFTVEV